MGKQTISRANLPKEEQAAEGKVAMAEYLAEPEQRAANMAKLREARLARDAVAALEAPVTKPGNKKTV